MNQRFNTILKREHNAQGMGLNSKANNPLNLCMHNICTGWCIDMGRVFPASHLWKSCNSRKRNYVTKKEVEHEKNVLYCPVRIGREKRNSLPSAMNLRITVYADNVLMFGCTLCPSALLSFPGQEHGPSRPHSFRQKLLFFVLACLPLLLDSSTAT